MNDLNAYMTTDIFSAVYDGFQGRIWNDADGWDDWSDDVPALRKHIEANPGVLWHCVVYVPTDHPEFRRVVHLPSMRKLADGETFDC